MDDINSSSKAIKSFETTYESFDNESVNFTKADASLFDAALKSSASTRVSDSPPTLPITSANTDNPLLTSLMKVSDTFAQDQQNISKAINKAVSGENHQMVMHASILLTEHQQRVQLLTKIVSKVTTGIDQLTRLQ